MRACVRAWRARCACGVCCRFGRRRQRSSTSTLHRAEAALQGGDTGAAALAMALRTHLFRPERGPDRCHPGADGGGTADRPRQHARQAHQTPARWSASFNISRERTAAGYTPAAMLTMTVTLRASSTVIPCPHSSLSPTLAQTKWTVTLHPSCNPAPAPIPTRTTRPSPQPSPLTPRLTAGLEWRREPEQASTPRAG